MTSGWLVRRVLLALVAALGVVVIVFTLIRLVPGDVVTNLIGLEGNVSAEQQAEMRRLFGLDQPIIVQFGQWFGALLGGDLGHSLRTDRPVLQDLLMRFPVTLELTVLALLFALLIAVPLGVVAALRRGKTADFLSSGFVLVGLAAPEFWLAILLILLFSLKLGWFPPNGFVPFWDNPAANLWHMFLPAFALSLSLAAAVTRIVRSSLLEVLSQDYVRTARAKGVTERSVVYRHAMRNALIPVITVVGLQVGNLLGGAVIIEQLFGLPGIGRFALEGINLRDYPVVQGAVLWIATTFVLVNLLVDVLYALVDRRVAYA
ncbi:peptide/nickel transport system permease protein [Deinobacterium chartae]|uniref:Peptide/nickel transport system permease protein n=1 Tax=Deinobacterium chartae TaxID=521158 RepID=A0A841HZP5_9DEIO|nr:ABC transporter permease [Deinobacterium chartae]MBB6098144.1 peptide/nickel transport system permease protein [Deinobacterium chartae]